MTQARVGGSVVAITGGARGIGRATAEAFARSGARVAIGDLDAELAKTTAAELTAATRTEVVGLPLDVADSASFEDFLDTAEQLLGPVDVLVNNAGIMPTGEFLDETPAMTELQIDVNIRGVIIGSRLAGRRFAARGRGHLVNIASLAGVTGEPGLATYCGTKHFVIGFTEALRRELRPGGVGVTMVLPGFINTELAAGTRPPAWSRALAVREPEDVAAAVMAAVVRDAGTVTVPAALGVLLTATRLVPGRVRPTVVNALGFGAIFTAPDRAQREKYHRRLAGEQ
ncbi:SDR family oxidoreductase, partial [Streptomyces sp. NPDC101166]|uniref:SDR family oxidoreductase n=1 Tax=Streptomyces sp. NPDC101166 TaxID=3366120 RepID=UPI003814BBE5